MIDRLLKLQERGRPLINSGRAAVSQIVQNNALKKEINALYQHYFGRAITGCKNCYVDALIELCTLNKKIAMDKTELFVVQRGKILRDTLKHDASLSLVRGNESEELCLYHLYTNPGARQYFELLPDRDTLDSMLSAYAEKFEAERNAEHGGGTGVAAADKLVNDAMVKAAEIEADATKLKDEAGLLKGEAATALDLANRAGADAAKALVDARAEAELIVADAKTEAAKLVGEAKTEAEGILNIAKAEAAETTKSGATSKKAAAKGEADPMLE